MGRSPRHCAGGAPDGTDAGVADERAEVAELAPLVPAEQRARFYELAQSGGLDERGATEFAALLAPTFAGTDELRSADAPPVEDVLAIWRAFSGGGVQKPTDEFGFAVGGAEAGPQAAGFLADLDPRKLVRLATVLQMKDRAGRVGARGVADLLEGLLVAGTARESTDHIPVHLVGHSYGGKVVLSAVVGKPHSRPVESVLLLQPAMSRLCFETNVLGQGFPGGYRPALERTVQPIMTTFSKHDFPLTKVFHLAVRRRSDLGEQQIGAAMSPYAALGGFGPEVSDSTITITPAVAPPEHYEYGGPDVRVIGVDSSDVIKGHGEISVPATYWMLLSQVARS